MSEKKEEFKINESENGTLYAGRLDIDGGSYIEGLPDYEWSFAIDAKNYEDLVRALLKKDDLTGDAEKELVKFLKENGTSVSDLVDVCKANDIEYHFANYM